MKRPLWFAALAIALAAPAWGAQAVPKVKPISLPNRSVEPVVLTGAQFPTWSAGPDPTLREPQAPGNPGALGGGVPADPLHQSDCAQQNGGQVEEDGTYDHNCYQSSRLPRNPIQGVAVDRLLGYRWSAALHTYVQIPFQVDQKFARYISNNASDFGAFSGVDQEDTYAFDREGFRYTYDKAWRETQAGRTPAPGDECIAAPRPGSTIINGYATTPDPVKGLNNDDELVFMARDAGSAAPSDASLPAGIADAYRVTVVDPARPGRVTYAYVMLARPGGPKPSFTAQNSPYIRYQRDPNAGMFVYSQSSYSNYGNAPKGPYCTPDGAPDTSHGAVAQRRPLDGAWITTPRYDFRYDGRWLMTQLHVSNAPKGDWSYGPDLIDRWKARAFAQDPGSKTPCCGYEEEATNWGGSSILMGERWGPVRVIRETWGADSSTNNGRREVFYRDSVEFGDALRVHLIPPLDGIYVQWDHNAGSVDRYFDPQLSKGIKIDGSNSHELYGNLDDPCNTRYDDTNDPNGHSTIDSTYRSTYKTAGLCALPYHQSVDVVDLSKSGAQGTLQWEEVSGPNGTLVSRWAVRDVTPGGAAQGIFAMPYYRDDSCFDDGTGTDPGPKLHLRSSDEPATWGYDSSGVPVSPAPAGSTAFPRLCWSPSDGPTNPGFSPQGDIRYYQGDIGTHGLHLMFVGESDNAYQTVPLTEIDSVQRMVIRPGCENPGDPAACNVGDAFGRSNDVPLETIAVPIDGVHVWQKLGPLPSPAVP